MLYTIYQITNNIDGKIYIGKHQTKNLDDGYMGSGKLLKRAIDKHGVENFRKEILFQFDNEADMNAKEAELVTEEFCSRDNTYNICPGGQGGFGYVNSLPRSSPSDETRQKISSSHKTRGTQAPPNTFDKRFRASQKLSRRHQSGEFRVGTFAGKSHTCDTKAKMSAAKCGSDNNQYGTMWITDGVSSTKMKRGDNIPEGWYAGRKIRSTS